jgi:hypothetical protein
MVLYVLQGEKDSEFNKKSGPFHTYTLNNDQGQKPVVTLPKACSQLFSRCRIFPMYIL